jgi:hypothetical protein
MDLVRKISRVELKTPNNDCRVQDAAGGGDMKKRPPDKRKMQVGCDDLHYHTQ